MAKNKFAAIVVAAGYSSRMHDFKPLLKFGGKTAIRTVIETLKLSGVNDIITVLGHRSEELEKSIGDCNVKCVYNENYPKGMYTSVVRGVEEVGTHISAFFIWPVDIPLIKEHTIINLMEKYNEKNQGIIHPSFDGKRGHPPLIDYKYAQAIILGDGEGGLKRLLDRYENDSYNLPLWDQAILMDMDTEEDYRKLLSYYNYRVPNEKECYELLKFYKVPDKIIKHSLKVAEVSLELYESMDNKAKNIDVGLLRAAALLHDIARMEKNHAEKGAEIIQSLGYSRLAHPISTHMDIAVDDEKDITEGEILYLADKLVKEDKILPLESRMQMQMELFKGDEFVLNKIEQRYDMAKKIMLKIKKTSGEK